MNKTQNLFDPTISIERNVICDLWENIGASETVHFLRNVLSELETLPSVLAAALADPSRNTEAIHKMAGKLATSGILTTSIKLRELEKNMINGVREDEKNICEEIEGSIGQAIDDVRAVIQVIKHHG